MTTQTERTIRTFNPGTFQPDAEVIRQFVVRERELTIVLDVLRDNVESPSCQHALIVAPRGRGKTMLLARVAAELRTDGVLSERLLPVRFMEESQEIMDSGDFWLEALFHLAAETAKRDSDFSQELRAAHDDLAGRWRAEELDRHARATVLDAADRLGRKLVLMVENLQDLCTDVDDDFGWKLREALQTEPQIILLATATSRFKGLDDPAQPFFEQFRTVHLEPLQTRECRRLWQVVSGEEVIDREIRPLQILTGGNPRLLVIVAQFARHRSLRQLMEEIVSLIDDHTEYFRSHLQGFAKIERLVYLAVIDLWQSSSTAEIAERCRRDVRTVSAMLGRLVNRGAVSVEGSGRKRRYAAAERLYSIYYKLRRQRDEAAVIQNLIRFMAAFYSGPQLAATIAKLSTEATLEPAIREGIDHARAEDPQVARLFSNLPSRVGEDAASANVNIVQAILDKALAHSKRDEHEAAIEVYDDLVKRFGDSEVLAFQAAVAVGLFNKAVLLSHQGRHDADVAVYDDLVERYRDSTVPALQKHVVRALINKGVSLSRHGNHDAAIHVYDELTERYGDSAEAVAMALINKGVTLGRQGKMGTEIAVYDKLVERFGDSKVREVQESVAKALFNKAVSLSSRRKHAAEIEIYDEMFERFGDSTVPGVQEQLAMALFNKGTELCRQGELVKGIGIYDDMIARYLDRDETDIQKLIAKSAVYTAIAHLQLHRPEGALRSCEVFDRLNVVVDTELRWKAVFIKTRALVKLGKHRDAMKAFGAVYADLFEPTDETTVRHMLAGVIELVAMGAQQRDLLEVLLRDEEKADALAPLVAALGKGIGVQVRASAEVLEVAKDIAEEIERRRASGL